MGDQAVESHEQSALAAAGGAADNDILPLFNDQVGLCKRLRTVRIAKAHPRKLNHFLSPPPEWNL